MRFKQAQRIIQLLKIAIEQGLLFNVPPVPTKHPETNKEYARRIYQQPNKDGYYTCGECEKYITEDEISYWFESGEHQQTFYNPKLNPEAKQRILNVLNEAKELTKTFLEEYNKLPDVPTGYVYQMPEAERERYYQIRAMHNRLIEDFNKSLSTLSEQYFGAEEEYGPLDFLHRQRIHSYDNSPGQVLESVHRITQIIDDEISKVKVNELLPVQHSSIIMVPLCEDCYNDKKVRCDWCGDTGILQGEDYGATFHEIEQDKYLCDKCYENLRICSKCGINLHADETMYEQGSEDDLCAKCYKEVANYDTEPVKEIINDIKPQELFLPVDTKQIEKTILPKILLPLQSRPFSLELIERQADKAKLPPELKTYLMEMAKSEAFSSIGDLINKLMRQVSNEVHYKNKYPNLKKFNKVPVDIDVISEHTDRDMPSFTITIRPTQDFINYSESLFPDMGRKAFEALSRGGHHPGAMAYARIGYDAKQDAFVVNNLQTDADMQKLIRSNNELPENLKPLEPAIRWWLKQFDNWPAQLLDIIREFGLKSDKAVYLTNFDMQKKKWRNIPERSRDVYDRIPQQMGFAKEDVDMNVETLGADNYEMYRVARLKRIEKLQKYAFAFEFFHGTSSKFLHRIMKEGLSSSPRERVWNETKRDPGEIGLESYPGVYVVNTFDIAYMAGQAAVKKFGGNLLIVAGRVETRTPEARLDEDHIVEPGAGIALHDRIVADWYKHLGILEHFAFDADDTSIRDASRAWVERTLELKPTEEVMNKAVDALRSWLDMRIALAIEREQSGSYAWTGIINKLRRRFGENIPDKYMKPQEAVKMYRQAMDNFLAKAKELLTQKKREQLLTSIRLTKPITYKGSNKIEAIVEIDEGDDPVQITIHYAANRAILGTILSAYDRFSGNRFEVK